MFDYVIYTDGGYSIGEGLGAGAFVILDGTGTTELKRRSFLVKNETNNRAELKAIIAAVYNVPNGSRVQVNTDSDYAILVLGRIPKTKNPKNPDLLALYRQIVGQKGVRVSFRWVRGHNGNHWNEVCDKLCTETTATGKEIRTKK